MSMQPFGSPLTASQQALQNRDRATMTVAQLHDWIDACRTMEDWVRNGAAKKAWTKSREQAEKELRRRERKAGGS